MFGLFPPLNSPAASGLALSVYIPFSALHLALARPLCAPDNKVNAILSPLPYGWEREDREHRVSDIEKQETRERERGRGGESPAR